MTDLMLWPNGKPPDTVAKRGHADRPGTGPKGETCKTCKHFTRRHYGKVYLKCGITNWTKGPGSDIRARDPACSFWEKKND